MDVREIQLDLHMCILVSTDNLSVVAYNNQQGGTQSHSIWDEAQLLLTILHQECVHLRAIHIPDRLNVIADML